MPGAVVIGAGPGIGRSVGLRFAREGMPVTLIARSPSTLAELAADVAAAGAAGEGAAGAAGVATVRADVTDVDELRAALNEAESRFGVPEVVVYNAAVIRPDVPGELTVREHQHAWAVNVVGALNAAAHVAPRMVERGSGTFVVTSGMPVPIPTYVSLSLGKAGVRALVTLLDAEYGPSGVHVASVTVDGEVAPGTDFDPDEIAEHYWRLHTEPRERWRSEVVHSRERVRVGS